jgi:hypothetical protein
MGGTALERASREVLGVTMRRCRVCKGKIVKEAPGAYFTLLICEKGHQYEASYPWVLKPTVQEIRNKVARRADFLK